MGSEVSRPHQQGGSTYNGNGNGSKVPPKKVSRRMSMGAGIPPSASRTPSIRVGGSGSTSFLDVHGNAENGDPAEGPRLSLSIDQLSPRSRSGSQASGSQSPNKQLQKQQRRCSLSMKNRQLIQSCFNNPHEQIGARILKRSAEKRKDFGRFFISIGLEHRERVGDTIKQLLKNSVANIYGGDEELQVLAVEFGQRFVEFRLLGFKADFFAVLADSTITECVLLDAAVHPAALTLTAFSQFITMLFSAVRDGFYSEMRRLRRTSNSFSTNSNGSMSTKKKLSVDDNVKLTNGRARSVSPSPELLQMNGGEKTSNSSPTGHGSQEEIGAEKMRESPRKITPPTPNSKKSTSVDPLKAREELRMLTAEFLGRSAKAMVASTGGKENEHSD